MTFGRYVAILIKDPNLLTGNNRTKLKQELLVKVYLWYGPKFIIIRYNLTKL